MKNQVQEVSERMNEDWIHFAADTVRRMEAALSDGLKRFVWVVATLTLMGSADRTSAAIWVIKPDGTEMRQVVKVLGYKGHGSPQWSHDGKRLAFDASPADNDAAQWFIVNLDGTGLQQVSENAMPSWSPDDKQLAYHNYGKGPRAGIWVQNMAGQGRSWLIDGYSPRWSPDGSRILYTDFRFLKTLNLVDKGEKAVNDKPFARIFTGFSWSRDGQRIAFVGQRDNNQPELMIVGPEGIKSRLVRAGMEGCLSWSADDKQLTVAIGRHIYLLDVDGNKEPVIIPGGENWSGSDPSWSPDGKWIALESDLRSRILSLEADKQPGK